MIFLPIDSKKKEKKELTFTSKAGLAKGRSSEGEGLESEDKGSEEGERTEIGECEGSEVESMAECEGSEAEFIWVISNGGLIGDDECIIGDGWDIGNGECAYR